MPLAGHNKPEKPNVQLNEILECSMRLTSFNPPARILLGAGPSPVHPRVLRALSRGTIGHLDPEFINLMESIKQGLREVFQTQNELTLAISAPASAAQETCVINLLEPGDTFIACVNGIFGERMAVMGERAGATVIRVNQPWGRAIDPDALRNALRLHSQAKLVGFVQAETSTGALTDAQALTTVAHEYDCLVLADAVTSLGGVPLRIDDWGIDAAFSASQKCLSCPPGLAPITFGPAARKAILNRRTPVRSWFMDMRLLLGYWNENGGRSYHHTAPVNALYGLHEALVMLFEEGLTQSWQRHDRQHRALAAGLEAMGLELAVPAGERLPPLTSVLVPEGVADAVVRQRLLDVYGMEIGAGLGSMAGKIWRIGLMGQGACSENTLLCLKAIEEIVAQEGAPIRHGEALPAAENLLLANTN